jgi:uncharacterized protein
MGSTPVMGRISQLWRYPVKSMLGERRQSLTVEQRGIQGDRLYAVRDADGKFGSGKDTRRFRKIDGLFSFAARHSDQLLEIHFPSGIIIGCQDAAVHGALSAALGQPVVLAQEAEISQLDAGPIHILTSASLVGSEQRFRMQESMSAVFVRTWLSIYPGKVWSNKSGSVGVCVSGERYS